MLKLVGVAISAFAISVVATAAHADSVGDCAWAKAAQSERPAYLSAYKHSIQAGTAQLDTVNSQLQEDVAACAGRNDIPPLWRHGVVGSVAIQDGAATTLATTLNLSKSALDAAWTQAPDAARDCTRANAAKAFGLNNLPCPDPKAPLWFLQRLGISPATDRADAEQALYYFNAKAQQQWADALIRRFMEKAPGA